MSELTNTDMAFVLSRCPSDVRRLVKDNPMRLFLAGGFIRSTIAGEKVSDIDLFGVSKEELTRLAKDLALSRKGRCHETDNAITVLSGSRIPVQFITRWTFDFPEALINSFDFTVCQAAIWAESQPPAPNETGEIIPRAARFYSEATDDFYPDLAARRLVYTSPVRVEELGGSLLRVIKMVKRGYNIQAPSLAGVVARVTSSLDFAKTPTEAEVAKVVTGLIREVDPLAIVDGVDMIDEHEIRQ